MPVKVSSHSIHIIFLPYRRFTIEKVSDKDYAAFIPKAIKQTHKQADKRVERKEITPCYRPSQSTTQKNLSENAVFYRI